MRLLGIDLGDRRIGLAFRDSQSGVARGLPTAPRVSDAADLRRLARLVAERGIEGEVVPGLPRNTDGSEGAQAAATRAWATGVLVRLGIPSIYGTSGTRRRTQRPALDAQPADRRAARHHRPRASDAGGPSIERPPG